MTIHGRPYRTLGDDDQLVYLACHGLEHYWHRIMWLCDVAMLLAAAGDGLVARALARCREERLESAVGSALLLCREALHVELPPAAASFPFDGRRLRMVVGLSRRTWKPPGRLATLAMRVEMRATRILVKPDPRFALRELLRFLISPRDFAAIDLPDRLFFLYVPLRPILWIARRLRGGG